MNRGLLLVWLLFMSATSHAAQADQQSYSMALRQGTPDERSYVLKRSLEISPSERQNVLWLAIADEIERVQSLDRRYKDALRRGEQPPEADAGGSEYWHDLIGAIIQWDDIRAIKPLISLAGDDFSAVRALVRFGDAAVSPLVETIRHGQVDLQTGAFLPLAILVEGVKSQDVDIPPAALSAASRSQILALARELLGKEPKQVSWPQLFGIARLALSTRDSTLRTRVEQLAQDPNVVSAYGLPPYARSSTERIQAVQHSLQTLLDQHPR